MNNSKNERIHESPDLFTECQRCGEDIEKGRSGTVSFKGSTMHFCDRCFKSVFKYDPSMKTVDMIWQNNGRNTPFIIRSSNWHRSSYMLIKEAKSSEGAKSGKSKTVYVGDFFLRGSLKEQNHVVGKANHFIWTPWSAELAEKYKEPEAPIEVPQEA